MLALCQSSLKTAQIPNCRTGLPWLPLAPDDLTYSSHQSSHYHEFLLNALATDWRERCTIDSSLPGTVLNWLCRLSVALRVMHLYHCLIFLGSRHSQFSLSALGVCNFCWPKPAFGEAWLSSGTTAWGRIHAVCFHMGLGNWESANVHVFSYFPQRLGLKGSHHGLVLKFKTTVQGGLA